MGTALTDAQVDAIARLAPKALFCQDPDSAGQESVARGIAALRAAQREWRDARGGVPHRPPAREAGPRGRRPAGGRGGDAGAARAAMPIERFEVERALEQPDASTDEMLADAARRSRRWPAACCATSSCSSPPTGSGQRALVNEVLRAPAPRQRAGRRGAGRRRAADGWGDRGGREGRPRRAAGTADATPRRGGGGRDRFREPDASARAGRPAHRARPPRAERGGVPRLLHRAARRGRAPPCGGRRRGLLLLARDAQGRGLPPRPPALAGGEPPAGDEALARLVAKLRPRRRLEATPAKLELEALQLDLHRLERHISSARISGGTSGVSALAAERQRVLDMIRHRLT